MMPKTFVKSAAASLSVCLSVCFSIGLVALPGAALAKGSFSSDGQVPVVTLPNQNPDHFSAGDQYVETVPTTKGPKATDDKGKGRGVKRTLALPREITKRLEQQGGDSAHKLIELATSPDLGAPGKGGLGGHKRSRGTRHHTSRSAPAVPSAAIDAVGGGEAGLGWLVAAVLTITALALGAVGYRRYRDKDASS